MARPARDVLRELMGIAARGLFDHYDVPIVEAAPRPYSIAAVCGYSSDVLRGTLGVAATEDFAARFYRQAMGDAPNDAQEDDWMAEMSNQLLGRVKTQLLGYDLAVTLATPGVLRGLELRVGGSRSDCLLKCSFTSEFGEFCVWLDARHAADLMLEERIQQDHDEEVALEGAMLFF